MDEDGFFLPNGDYITVDGEVVKKNEKKVIQSGPKWFKGIKGGFKVLANLELTLIDHRLFEMMLGHIKYGSRVIINQAHYAELLHAERATISRSLKRLELCGILSQEEKVGQVRVYKIHPAYCWTGNDNRRRK